MHMSVARLSEEKASRTGSEVTKAPVTSSSGELECQGTGSLTGNSAFEGSNAFREGEERGNHNLPKQITHSLSGPGESARLAAVHSYPSLPPPSLSIR